MIDRLVVWALTLKERARSGRGQDVMEYAILTGGIAVVLLAALVLFTDSVSDFFDRLGSFMNGLVPGWEE